VGILSAKPKHTTSPAVGFSRRHKNIFTKNINSEINTWILTINIWQHSQLVDLVLKQLAQVE
jgi:hypothetical protein